MVAQRAANQQERGKCQDIARNYPQQGRDTGVKIAADGRERDFDDRRMILTTVASSAAIPDPSTVIASTHRPGAEE